MEDTWTLWRGVIHHKYTATPNSGRQVRVLAVDSPRTSGPFTPKYWPCPVGTSFIALGYWRHTLVTAHTLKKRAFIFVNGCEFNSSISMATPVPVVAGLLRTWVRIPPGACMFIVSVVCCQVEVSVKSSSLVQRSPPNCAASLYVI